MLRVAEIKNWLKVFVALYGRRIVLSIAAAFCVGVLDLLVCYLVPATIHVSYAKSESCTITPILFPHPIHPSNKDVFALRYGLASRIAGVTLYAGEVCVVPQQTPGASSSYVMTRTLSYVSPLKKKITIRTAQYVSASLVITKEPLTLTNSLHFELSQADDTFTYAVTVNGRQDICIEKTNQLSCPLNQLSLQYGQQYNAQLVRTFKSHTVQQIAHMSFQTISATSITSASVSNGSTVYDTPQQFTFQTDKPLTAVGKVTLSAKKADGTEQAVATSATFSGTTITLSAAQTLPRKATMHLVISSVRAQDSSGLAAPYDITFYVSGGPRVTSTTLASYDATAAPITINFDQALNPNQGTSQVSLSANGSALPIRATISASKITIMPQTAYPVCAHLTLMVGPAMANTYGISGDSAYTYASRAQCHTTFSIGTSVQGRPLTAYQIGSGPTQLLFVGTMHGNEQNAGSLLNAWLNELEANVDSIPAGRMITIIPQINPDGAAANTRVNADNIDINRNFPASSWQSVVTEPDGSTGPYGGTTSLSEPESQAIANYVKTQRPAITVDYHSHAGVVQGNDAGNADALALQYALTSGYSELSSSETGTEFDYSTTGSFEDWTNQALGLPEFLVELSSPTHNEFSRNRQAMWNLVKGSL